MKDLTFNTSSSSDGSVEVEICKGNHHYEKVPAEEMGQHKSFMSHCMANADMYVNTDGLDENRAYMACAIAYDQKYKTAYAPCVPGVGCFY